MERTEIERIRRHTEQQKEMRKKITRLREWCLSVLVLCIWCAVLGVAGGMEHGQIGVLHGTLIMAVLLGAVYGCMKLL
jgi:hypothetical protein